MQDIGSKDILRFLQQLIFQMTDKIMYISLETSEFAENFVPLMRTECKQRMTSAMSSRKQDR